MTRGFRKFVAACLRWKDILGLQDYAFTFRRLPEDVAKKRDDDENHGEDSNFAIFGVTETLTEYRRVIIEVKETSFKGVSDEDIDDRACHEVVHVLMSPYCDVSWEMLHELPPGKREVYRTWRRREGEELTSKLAGILRSLKRAPKAK